MENARKSLIKALRIAAARFISKDISVKVAAVLECVKCIMPEGLMMLEKKFNISVEYAEWVMKIRIKPSA